MIRAIKNLLIQSLWVIGAGAVVIFLLKAGGEAGARKVREITGPVVVTTAELDPVRPQIIEGEIDNFHGPIAARPFRSWGEDLKRGFMLAVAANPNMNQPRMRVKLQHDTAAPIVVNIQYTVLEDSIRSITANSVASRRFDGVTVLVTTEGGVYKNSGILRLDPQRRAEDRKWLSQDVVLPAGTREIDFAIIATAPQYSVYWASCAISLPQLRVAPAGTAPPADTKPTGVIDSGGSITNTNVPP